MGDTPLELDIGAFWAARPLIWLREIVGLDNSRSTVYNSLNCLSYILHFFVSHVL